MKTIKMCALLMLLVLSLSFVSAAISNTDGSSIIPTPSLTNNPPPAEVQETVQEETSSNLSTSSKILIVVVPILILLIGLYILKKRRRKKFREFDDQPKDIDKERLWKNAKEVKKVEPQRDPLIEAEKMMKKTTEELLTEPKKVTGDEKEKARLAIEEILEEAKLRDKPGFDDPTQDVTTYK